FPLGAESIKTNSYYGRNVAQPTVMNNVDCSGEERSLFSCSYTGDICNNEHIAGVKCQGPVRLQGGDSSHGRVEVYTQGRWGTICSEQWDIQDAIVLCRELGFSTGASSARDPDVTDLATGDIWMWDTECDGSEDSIFYCLSGKPIGSPPSTCTHSTDASVICICFEGAVRPLYSAFYGVSVGDIRPYQMNCLGTEYSIADCPLQNVNSSTCDHSKDASVICQTQSVHLVGGHTPYEGRVEYFDSGEWRSVCNNGWDINDIEVVCKELVVSHTRSSQNKPYNFPHFHAGLIKSGHILGAKLVVTRNYFGSGVGNLSLDQVECSGSETRLKECTSIIASRCDHSQDAELICKPTVRLVDGTTNHKGRVVIYSDGVWRSIANTMWEITDANVVCKELGFTLGANMDDCCPAYDASHGPLWGDMVQCTGTEHSVRNCWHSTTADSGLMAAGVNCIGQ
ncbi:scavenger receptor cysteine-rich domain superfamily protein-like, partial [Saccoglossus kowalevskii]